uniref:Uncharacterized protein n=1 Tax=Oryza barthii TaxID=65489 RepID=A0A0D3FN98_9ORYZ
MAAARAAVSFGMHMHVELRLVSCLGAHLRSCVRRRSLNDDGKPRNSPAAMDGVGSLRASGCQGKEGDNSKPI